MWSTLLAAILDFIVKALPVTAAFVAGRASAKPDGTEHAREASSIDEDVASLSDAALNRELFDRK